MWYISTQWEDLNLPAGDGCRYLFAKKKANKRWNIIPLYYSSTYQELYNRAVVYNVQNVQPKCRHNEHTV